MITRATVLLLAVLLIAGAWMGCKENPPASLYDPSYVSGPQPKVTGITPATGALAGVTTLTITGQNFSTDPASNLVFFDKSLATVLSATATQLQLKAPQLAKDSIKVKVAVYKSDLFSDPYLFKLDTATFDKYASFGAGEEGLGIECDAAGNLYVSMINASGGIGVKKFTATGVRSDYSPAFSSTVPSWKSMKFGPGGALYCFNAGRTIIFSIPAGGGTAAVWKNAGGLGLMGDLDFDADGNIWAAGSTGNIYKVTPAKVVSVFPCVGTLRAIRVYNGAVYVGGKRDSLEKVWKYPLIGADSLDAEQDYFNLSTVYGANSSGVYALTFSSDGDLFIGTDNAESIRVVHPSKASEAYYAGLLKGGTVSMCWGKGSDLFQSRSSVPGPAAAIRINTQKTGAPYYGRQ